MDYFLSQVILVPTSKAISKKSKVRITINWLNSVCNRTILYGTTDDGKRITILIVRKGFPLGSLTKFFSTPEKLIPDNTELDIHNSDIYMFLQNRRDFKIRKSISFRVVGSGLVHDKATGGSIVKELTLVCNCSL
jgi:hypothetical protein